MIEKKFYFLAGLPRAGSTVLASILNQNPEIYVTPTSPLLDLLEYNEYLWNQTPSVIANPIPNKNFDISQAVINGCWEHQPQKIIIDKCRGWINHVPTIKTVFQQDAKIIVNVRDIPSILASYLRVLRNTPSSYIDEELTKKGCWLNDANRVNLVWQMHVQPVLQWMKDASTKYPNNLLLIEYDDLVTIPENTIKKIYDFLELPEYNHQFNNIENTTPENDLDAWKVKDLHKINPELKKTSITPEEILGKSIFTKYSRMECEFWRK